MTYNNCADSICTIIMGDTCKYYLTEIMQQAVAQFLGELGAELSFYDRV